MLTTHRRNSRTRIDDCKYLMFFPPKQALSLLSLLYGLSSIKLLFGKWWVWVDSNHRPHPYQGCALTKLSYRPKVVCMNQQSANLRSKDYKSGVFFCKRKASY